MNPNSKRRTIAFVTSIILGACGGTAESPSNQPRMLTAETSDIPYPDEPWDPGPAPWDDCLNGYDETCDDMYSSGSSSYGEGSLCIHGTWDPYGNDGEGTCLCNEGYTSINCSECDIGFTMTATGCVSE